MKNSRLKYSPKVLGNLIIEAFRELMKNDPLRMAGATAFFTTFALPPILIILTQVLGLLFNPNAIRGKMFEKLEVIIGSEGVQQVMETIAAFRLLAQNWFLTIGGFIFLVFIATTLFNVIKNSINQIWKIKVVRKTNFWFGLRNRFHAIFVILVAGFLLVVGLLIEGIQVFLGNYFREIAPGIVYYLNSALSYLLTIFIVMFWFAFMFRYLPDGKPAWRIAFIGALFTSILFNAGRLLLRWLLTYSNIDTLYGASGSIVLLLLFVFYCSFILYYGAAFTKVLAMQLGRPIVPRLNAIHYQIAEVSEVEDIRSKREHSSNRN